MVGEGTKVVVVDDSQTGTVIDFGVSSHYVSCAVSNNSPIDKNSEREKRKQEEERIKRMKEGWKLDRKRYR